MKISKYILLIFLCITFGCDIFETRSPEDPDTPRSTFIAAATPDILFQNLSSSFRDQTVDNYMRNFVDDFSDTKIFVFVSSPGAIVKFPSLSQWQRENEESYFRNLITAVKEEAVINLNLSDVIFNVTQGDSAVYQIGYSMIVPFADKDSSTTFKGNAEFKLNLNSQNQWVINRWEDAEVDGFPSWSELKGQFN